jgi:hypothetical protein
MGTAETNITNLGTRADRLQSNIEDLQDFEESASEDITTLKTNVSTNATAIETNKTAIATNATAIATNKINIATNTTDISNLKTRADGLQKDIEDVQDDVATILNDYVSKSAKGKQEIASPLYIKNSLTMNRLYLPNEDNEPSSYELMVGVLGAGADTPEGGGGSVNGLSKVNVFLGAGTTPYSTNAMGDVVLPAYPTTLPASDVYAWAKAATKPTYTASEVGALSTSGGTITGTSTYLLNINSTSTAVGVRLRLNDEGKTAMIYDTTSGSYIYDYTTKKYLGINIDGLPYYYDGSSQRTLIHSGNIGSQSVNAVYNSSTYIGAASDAYPELYGSIIFSYGDNPIHFYTNYQERMIITGGGNVLIGTTTDNGTKLYVSGDARFDGQTRINGSMRFYGKMNVSSDMYIDNQSVGGLNFTWVGKVAPPIPTNPAFFIAPIISSLERFS